MPVGRFEYKARKSGKLAAPSRKAFAISQKQSGTEAGCVPLKSARMPANTQIYISTTQK